MTKAPTQHADTTYAQLKTNLSEHLRGLFPVEGKKNKLILKSLEIKDDADPWDYRKQKTARIEGKSWTVPVVARFELQDLVTGKVIDRSRMKIIDLPRLTNRGSYIVGGSEYMFPIQKRLRSGPYTRTGQDGELRTFFNLAKGRNFHLGIHPAKGHFQFQIDSSKNIFLYPVLKALGVTDDQMRRAWGPEVFKANLIVDDSVSTKALRTVFEKMSYGEDAPESSELPGAIRDLFSGTKMDEDNTALILGRKSGVVDGTTLLATTKKMLSVSQGRAKEDNRDSLIHNDIVDLSDFVVERFQDFQFRNRITRAIRFNIDRRDKVSKIVSRDSFQRPMDSLFTESQLSQSPTQTNPLGMISDYTAVTVRGEGGIQQENALTRSVRALDPSHLGFLDPAHTPEGSNVGTTLHLTINTRKKGKNLVTRVLNARTGKVEELTPVQIFKSVVAFPEHVRGKKIVGPRVKAHEKGQVVTVDPGDVDYAFMAPEHLIDLNTATIPFTSHNNGARVMLASKMGVQAKPLEDAEAPMVQAGLERGTVSGVVGKSFSPKSPVNGVVEKVGKDEIVIDGKSVKIPNYFPLNSNNFLHARPKVKVGDKVTKGQVIADTNYTKNGELAIGKNLRVAYVPFKGMNVEDGVVISDGAASKMTSEHLYQQSYPFDTDTILDLKKFTAYFPAKITSDQAKTLDGDGVIKKGQKIEFGSVLVASMRKRDLGTESQRMARISRILAKDYRDDSLTWDKRVSGVVQEVAKRANEIVVHIRTKEPMRIGDKVVGRYGNKGIVVQIMPDDEMPRDEKGRGMEMLLNPNGVVSRMNLGQILETTASRIADKTGKTYISRGFGENSAKRIAGDLKKNGLKDHDTIFDPVENQKIPGVLTGKQYIYKLEHQATKKISARGGGPEEIYSAEGQPVRGPGGGRGIGAMELYALLGHGALANVDEMYGIKSNFDPEVWRAIESGAPLPPPRASHGQEKFRSMLKGMGVNIEQQGQGMALIPFLDRDIKKVSSGEITNFRILRGKDLKEEKGGLFDPERTGGIQGDRWSHIKLPEPMPNPTFEKAVLSLLHMKKSEFDEIMAGKKSVNGLSGGQAIKKMLSDVDVGKRLKEASVEILGKSGSTLNALHREIRFLRALKAGGIKPQEYVIENLPVLPPKFRPVYVMGDGNLNVSDVNLHYQTVLQVSDQMKKMKGKEFVEERKKLGDQLYKSVSGVMGFNDGIVERKGVKGLARTLAGVSGPKGGYFQSRLIKKRQDVSATSVIVANPKLGIDEVGVPEALAWKTFRPFLIRELRTMGMTPLGAKSAINERSPQARKALENVMKERHVILNRAPTLHKFSVMAFKPRLVPGYAIEIPPLVVGGFNADFDGDEVLAKIFVYIPLSVIDDSSKPPEWWSHRLVGGRDMAARFGVMTPVFEDGRFFIFDMEDFPREDLIDKQNNIDVYSVRKGIKVLALNERGKIALADVMFWTFHREKEIVIINLGGDRQMMADDDPRAIFGIDPKTMDYGRWRPCDGVGKMVPMAKDTEIDDAKTTIFLPKSKEDDGFHDVMEKTRDAGWFIGATVGDGWVEHHNGKPQRVCIASNYDDIQSRWTAATSEFFEHVHVGNRVSTRESIDGVMREQQARVISREAFAEFMVGIIGHGAKSKFLPPFALSSCREFRMGLLEGLMDTDGSCSWNKSRSKPQFNCSYSTSSSRLAREIVLLCRSLGVSSSITPHTRKDNGRKTYVVSMSSPDIYGLGLNLVRENKRSALSEFEAGSKPVVKGRSVELVPLGGDAAKVAMRLCRSNGDDASYASCSKARTKAGYVSRTAGEKIVSYAEAEDSFPDELLCFRSLVTNRDVSWLPVLGFENTGIIENGYDLTVPGYETFMSVDGVILSNTMGLHVPISAEANNEASEMLPSKHLYKPGSKKLQPKIEHEYVLGLFKISRVGKVTTKRFQSTGQVLSELRARKISPDAGISVMGLGSTTPGRILINESIPSKLRDYRLVWTDRTIQDKLVEIDEKEGRKAFVRTLQALADIGRRYAYLTGSSFLLSDLQTMSKARNAAYARADTQADRIRRGAGTDDAKRKKIIKVYEGVGGKLRDNISMGPNDAKASNNIMDMMEAGARGNPNQVMQMVSSIGVMLDHENRPMPEPVRGTYTEGLSTSEFFQHMYGNRKGMIDRSQSVRDPGALTKQVIVSAAGHRVTMTDCKTKNGIFEPTSGTSTLDRYLAEGIRGHARRNQLVTSDLLSSLRAKGVQGLKVRSPLTCQAPSGVCVLCYGMNEEGRPASIGEYTGIKDTQGLTEPSTQLAMKCNAEGNVITVRHAGKIKSMTMEQLWENAASHVQDNDGVEMKIPIGYEVWDHGSFTVINALERHRPEEKMMMVTTSSGAAFISQSNHPNWARLSSPMCPSCKSSTPLKFKSHYKSSVKTCVSCRDCGHGFTITKKQYEDQQERIVATGDLSGYTLPRSIPPVGGREDFPLPPYLLGISLAEGCVSRRKKDSRIKTGSKKRQCVSDGFDTYVTGFSITQNPGKIRNKIEKELTSSGIAFSANGKKTMQINDVNLGRRMWSECGIHSKNKRLPSGWDGMSESWMRSVLAGLLDGDGSVGEYNGSLFYSTSWSLISQVMMMCLRLGYKTSVVATTNKKLTRNQCFCLTIHLKEKLPSVKNFKTSRTSTSENEYEKVKQVKEVMYNGWTYDMSTSSRSFTVNGIRTHNTFHTGGVAAAGGGLTSGFDRVKQLFTMPENISEAAVLSEVGGRVIEVSDSPFGGQVVIVAGVKHKVPRGRRVSVKIGDRVEKGQRISNGNIKPQDMLRLNGLRAMQIQLRDDVQRVYAEGGENIHAKTVETPVRILTETVRISDPGDHPSLITGDHSTYGQVDSWNREHKSQKPARYVHVLPGAEQMPHKSDDWALRMAHNRIGQVLQEAPAMGSKAQLAGGSPFGALIFGKRIEKDPWTPGGLTSG